MPDIQSEINAYVGMQKDLESHHKGKWVVIHEGQLIGTFDTFESAAAEAVALFGAGPYLIREVGAPPLVLPASVMYHPANAKN